MGQRLFIYAAVAVSLGVISPEIARVFDLSVAHGRSGVLYWWLIGMPSTVDVFFRPADDMRLVLWSTTFSAMYLAMFGFAGLLVSGVRGFIHRNDDHSEAFEAAATQFTQHDW